MGRDAQIPFDMFDLAPLAEDARRARKLAHIYHQGQKLAWDGRKVLTELKEKHGPIELPEEKKRALARVFSVILWGELAAWKISAQMADMLVPLEAKMAATAQTHDEARHFYVMHDYLEFLGVPLSPLDPPARKALELVLNTDSLLEKMTGMQLLVEPFALTIFHLVREENVEPILCDLLKFYERDEARHVGLGVQHLPMVMKEAGRLRNAKTLLFQGHVMAWTLRGMQELSDDFEALGFSNARVLELGRNKIFSATEQLWQGMGVKRPPSRKTLEAGVDAMTAMAFPRRATHWLGRLKEARAVWKQGGYGAHEVALTDA